MATKVQVQIKDAAYYRELLGGTQKPVKAEVPITFFDGPINKVLAKITDLAECDSWDSWQVKIRESGYGYYNNGRQYGHRPAQFIITGMREYTDEELVAEGEKLVKAKAVAEAKLAKKRATQIKQYNTLAQSLGQPLIEA